MMYMYMYHLSRTLVAGTISGDVLFYTVKLEAAAADESVLPPSGKNAALKHMQTAAHVCGGSVRCLTWSKDSRLAGSSPSPQHKNTQHKHTPSLASSSGTIFLSFQCYTLGEPGDEATPSPLLQF